MSPIPAICFAVALAGCRLLGVPGAQDADPGADTGLDADTGPVDCRTVAEDEDEALDGVIDRRVTERYDPDGNLLSQAVDHGADGTAETFVALLYDADGRLSSYELDSDGDGALDSRVTYTYSAGGDLVEVSGDVGPDGIVDSLITSTWDADHHILTQDWTCPTDTEADAGYWAWTWDARGNLATLTVDAGDYDSRTLYAYDADDHEVWEEAWQADVLDWVRASTWSGDLLATEAVDLAGDGSFETVTTLTYDENGWLTLLEQVNTADGTVNIAMAYTYDERGNELSEQVTTDTWELRASTWDADDNLLSKLYTYEDPSREPFVFRYVYTDGC